MVILHLWPYSCTQSDFGLQGFPSLPALPGLNVIFAAKVSEIEKNEAYQQILLKLQAMIPETSIN